MKKNIFNIVELRKTVRKHILEQIENKDIIIGSEDKIPEFIPEFIPPDSDDDDSNINSKTNSKEENKKDETHIIHTSRGGCFFW